MKDKSLKNAGESLNNQTMERRLLDASIHPLLLNIRIEFHYSSFNVVHRSDYARVTVFQHGIQQRAFASELLDSQLHILIRHFFAPSRH